MTTPGYQKEITEYIRANALPPDKFSHQPRLYRLAMRLAEGKSFDDEVLFAAAWLHDLGVFVGHRPEGQAELATWDHVAYVFKQAPILLHQLKFPAAKIPAVLEVVRTHLPSAVPTCFEGVLLRDADILEQLGAVSILRTVSKVGRDTRFILFSDALRVLEKNLAELPDKLQLDISRQLAKPKLRILREFLEAARAEADGVEW